MERIRIHETKKTPYVLFSGTEGTLEIRGRSVAEEPHEFYEEIIDGVDQYKKDHTKKLEVQFDFEYFNTPTARQILRLLRKLKEIKCEVIWIYESDDEEMLEAGEDYAEVSKTKFTYYGKPE